MIRFHDGWDADDLDDELDPDDLDECPRRGRLMADDFESCPRCGADLSRAGAGRRQPWWVMAGALVCLAMVVYWILHP